jgi:hypothetical protein
VTEKRKVLRTRKGRNASLKNCGNFHSQMLSNKRIPNSTQCAKNYKSVLKLSPPSRNLMLKSSSSYNRSVYKFSLIDFFFPTHCKVHFFPLYSINMFPSTSNVVATKFSLADAEQQKNSKLLPYNVPKTTILFLS